MARNLIIVALSVVVAATAVSASAAQEFALVDIGKVIANSDRGQEIPKQLQREFETQIEALRTKESDLVALRNQLAAKSQTVSGSALEDLRREFEDAQLEVQRMTEDLERAVEKRKTDLYNVLEVKALNVIEEIRKEKGLAGIFAKGGTGFLAVDPKLEITSEVLHRLNTTP